jgi:3'-phosphoadenosine 5'-phosphosulfate sulfotransferase (PAPS reductase)/FAD synthetase
MLNARPNIEAAILGTRNSDPNAASQKKFLPTDADWPKLMRVNPILQWKYSDIWCSASKTCWELGNRERITNVKCLF